MTARARVAEALRLLKAIEAAEAALPHLAWLEIDGVGAGQYTVEARHWPKRSDVVVLARAGRLPLTEALESIAAQLAARPGTVDAG